MRELLLRNKENGRWTHSLREQGLPDWVEDHERGFEQADKFCRILNAMEELLKIVPKAAKDPIPFRMNTAQVVLANVVLWCWAIGASAYLIVPKARQMGITTWFSGYFFTRCVTERNFRSMVVAHVEKTAQEVFRMARTFERELPDDWKYELDSKSKDLISWTAGSKLQIGMVGEGGGDALGKGFTLNGLHGTEVANWGDRYDADSAWSSVSGSIVEGPELVVGYESTGKGRDPVFHKTWQHAGERGFVRVFLPWYLDEQYSLSRAGYTAWCRKSDLHAEVDFELTDAERDLQMKVAGLVVEPGYENAVHPRVLTLEQFLWRRVTIATKCFGDVAKFDRYFPSVWQDAFRVAGDSPFGNEAVENLYSRVKIPTVGRMNGGNFYPGQESDKWEVRVWKAPEPRGKYVVAVDPSDGVEGGDPAAAYVLRYWKGRRLFETVAAIYGTIDEDTLASQAAQLAQAYNECVLAIEKNRPNCVNAAARVYKKLYRHKHSDPTDDKLKATSKPGFHMNAQTRPAVMALLKEVSRDDRLHNYCDVLPEEVEALESKGGKWQAKKGAHDDAVIAVGIGLYVAHELAGLNKRSKAAPGRRSNLRMTQPDFSRVEALTAGFESAKAHERWAKRMGINGDNGSKQFTTLG